MITEGEINAKTPEEQAKQYKMIADKYKQMLRCKVCNTRTKDVLLAKCCHLFCRECITKNLQIRQRSCPTCRQKFTFDDVKQLWLES